MTSETRSGRSSCLLPRLAMAAIGGSILLTIGLGLLGPSAVVPALGGPAWHPPYSLALQPGPHLVVSLAAAAILLGGLGLLGALFAVRAIPPTAGRPGGTSGPRGGSGETPGGPGSRGMAVRWGRWRGMPSARVLVLVGCVAAGVLAFLPPSGSGDHLNYAAYGRMVVLGVDPYTHGAVDLSGDPVADAVEAPWREEPSVYGPIATAVQALASWAGGDSVRLTIFVLALFNAGAFIATGLLIDRFTRDDPARRLRAALLWTANPLLLYQLVAGMHVDTLAIACMVAALLARGRPVGSGLLLGAGVAIKLNAGLVALGLAWELRRRPGRLALMAGAAVAVVVAGYAVVGIDAVAPVTRTSKAISHASFWKLVQGWLQEIVGVGHAYRGEIQIGSLVVLALVAWSLFRLASRAPGKGSPILSVGPAQGGLPPSAANVRGGLPPSADDARSELPPSADARRGGLPSSAGGGRVELSAEVVAAVLACAYVFATPYVLPWYDGLAFAMLALVTASALDGFLVLHLLVLSLAYLPARVVGQPPDLEWLRTVVRAQVVPWVLLGLTIGLVWWAWRAAGRVRRRPEPAAPPR
ncbi:polyprenol phosphomannose-dependent alpha 1,6 mannosyltransferase MptB [Nonomuraea cavernae]|uniref:polyprenol phosphomannose-dependent alpha 1,6 mannosyltransferase MptB n=1 Tax=Nonomuraea cavernae TaxID=2045107 RepID=UPI003407578B